MNIIKFYKKNDQYIYISIFNNILTKYILKSEWDYKIIIKYTNSDIKFFDSKNDQIDIYDEDDDEFNLY